MAVFKHPVRVMRKLGACFKRNDLVWIHLPNYIGVMAWLVCLLQRKRYILTIGGNWPKVRREAYKRRNLSFIGIIVGWLYKCLFWAMIHGSKLTLTNGEELTQIYGRNKPRVLPYFSSTVNEADIALDVASSNTDRRCILYVGRLGALKGLKELFLSVKDLLSMNLNVQLRVVGDGECRDDFVEFAKELGIEEHVDFLGWIAMGPALNALYRSADVLAQSSYTETGPKVVSEAMANGLPIVSTKVGYAPVIIENGKTGLIIPAHDEAALRDALYKILSDEQLRQNIGKAGLVRVREFTMEAQHKSMTEALGKFGLLRRVEES